MDKEERSHGSRPLDPKGRAALVTGASRGLGRAIAEQLASRGAKVALVARGGEALEEVVASIRKNGGEAHAIVGDVADEDATYRIAATAAAVVGPVEILVHAASALGPTPLRLLLDTDCEDLASVLETNVVGPFRLTKAVAGAMAIRGGGTIVSISSDAASGAYPRWGAYGGSKAAFDLLTRTFAAELEPMGVRAIVVDPGEMDTQMHRDAFGDAHDPSALSKPDYVATRIVEMILDDARAKSGGRYDASQWGAS